VLGRIRMASGREEALEHVLLVLEATKRAVFCWQCFSDLGLALLVYLRCLR
jgi:hypothetical protein